MNTYKKIENEDMKNIHGGGGKTTPRRANSPRDGEVDVPFVQGGSGFEVTNGPTLNDGSTFQNLNTPFQP